jgi:hypothetical protein
MGCSLAVPLENSDVVANFPAVGRWVVTAFPPGWLFLVGLGIKQMMADGQTLPASVVLREDVLEAPDTLEIYIAKQARLIQQYLTAVKLAGPQLTAFHGAEEGQLLIARHSPEGYESMLQAQTYVRAGNWIGIVTLTTPEARLRAVRTDYDAFVRGLRIRGESHPSP